MKDIDFENQVLDLINNRNIPTGQIIKVFNKIMFDKINKDLNEDE